MLSPNKKELLVAYINQLENQITELSLLLENLKNQLHEIKSL